jgi:hypothetical protein
MIAIVDYGMGNLRSVQKGFERAGFPATISGDPEFLARADKIVLPGVGAFGDAMAELRRAALIEPILDAIRQNKPFLGICLGLQLLFEVSHEGSAPTGSPCVVWGSWQARWSASSCLARTRSLIWVGIRFAFGTDHRSSTDWATGPISTLCTRITSLPKTTA